MSQPDALPLHLIKVVMYILTQYKNFHQIQHHMNILSSLYSVRTQDILFYVVEFQQRYRENASVLGDVYLRHLSQIMQQISVQHMNKITRVNVIL